MVENQFDLGAVIETIEGIPTLPVISQQVMDIKEDDPNSHSKYVDVIEKDQALSVKLLKLANSAFYGSLSRISSIDNAIVRLGMKEVRSVVLAFSVLDFFSSEGDEGYDRNLFWKHAVVCSQVAKYLGNHYRIRNDDTLFIAGLIHDVGKVVLDEYFHEEFLEVLEVVQKHHTTFSKAEKKVLGTTHYQIAAKLLKQWRFPAKVIMQVLYHHAPWHDKNSESASIIIYLANIFTKLAGYSCHPDEKQLDPAILAASPEAEYVTKSGFDMDLRTLQNMTSHIRDYIQEETENVLTLFD
jgi:putative nucleotidyltransferase with HDIG domain